MAICIQKAFGQPVTPMTAEDFEEVLDRPAVAEIYKICRAHYREYEQYKKDHGGSPLIPLYISFEWSDIKYLIVWRENQIEPLRKKLEKFGCDNHSIGIFSQNRIKHDFIGVAHNVGRKKKNIERAQKMRDMEATIKSQEESRQQLKQSLENILKQL